MCQQDLFDFRMKWSNCENYPDFCTNNTNHVFFFFFEKEKQSRLIFLDVSQLFHRSFGSRKTRCHLLLLLPKAQRGWFVVRNVACLGRIGISTTQPTCVEKRQKFAFWAGWFMILKSETGHGSYCGLSCYPSNPLENCHRYSWSLNMKVSHNFVLLLELIGLCSRDFFVFFVLTFHHFIQGCINKKVPLKLKK